MNNITLVKPQKIHASEFLKAARRSVALHKGWVRPPRTNQEFIKYLVKIAKPNQAAFLIFYREELIGVINVNEIVMGSFKSGYLGYYVFESYSGKGLMGMALGKVMSECFGRMGLNRLEANIQLGNFRSRRLVKKLGFRLEGMSERYLKIGGRWRDHERWAIHRKEWSQRGAA